MLHSNKVNIVLSIIISILLWMYVVGQVDPDTTRKIDDIPITFTNAEVLAENGLAIVSSDADTVSVTIKGKRADVSKVTAEDIKISADVSDLGKGKNAVTLTIETPDVTSVVKESSGTITVEVESLVSKKFSVEPNFTGITSGDIEPGNVSIDPSTVYVSGGSTSMAKIDKVVATVDVKKIKEEGTSITSPVTALDESGKPIPYLQFSQRKVVVEATLLTIKSVPLKINTTGNVDSSVELDSVEGPGKVIIKGPQSAVDKILSVESKPIDISGITSTATIPISVILPEGVELANESISPYATVKIKENEIRKFPYTQKDIKINNLPRGLKAVISPVDVEVTVGGTASLVGGLVAKDITLTVDGKKLSVGTQRVNLEYNISKKVGSVILSPTNVEIIVSEE